MSNFIPANIPCGLYIHLPWCLKKCPYCDFNSHSTQGKALTSTQEQNYMLALKKDLDFESNFSGARQISSIFIGGGTPNLFSPDSFFEILNHTRALWQVNPQIDNIEITLEANPGARENQDFVGFKAAGINRISIGAQSFDAAQLRKLGRIHDPNAIVDTFEKVKNAGFTAINLDLMYGLPAQSIAQALDDLQKAIDLQPTHLSWYQLTLEPQTPFAEKPPAYLPENDALWEMQTAGQALLAKNGYHQYEVSAYFHEKTGKPCTHNVNYWEFGDYLAVGAGAHGKLSFHNIDENHDLHIIRRARQKYPNAYQLHVGTPASLESDQMILPENQTFEFLLNALRLKAGFDENCFETRTQQSAQNLTKQFARAVKQDLIEKITQNQTITWRATPRGQAMLDAILRDFL